MKQNKYLIKYLIKMDDNQDEIIFDEYRKIVNYNVFTDKDDLEILLSLKSKIGLELGEPKLLYIEKEKLFLIDYNDFYVSSIGFYGGLRYCIEKYINKKFITTEIEINLNNVKIKEVNIDTIINITPKVNEYTDFIIEYLYEWKILYKFINIPNITYDISSRMKFNNIYDNIKDLKIGNCRGNHKIYYKFIKKILKLHNLNASINSMIFNLDNYEIKYSSLKKTKSNIIIIFMALLSEKWKDTGHANLILINKNDKTIERFEPNGTDEEDDLYIHQKIDDELIKFFTDKFKNYEYSKPSEFCNISSNEKGFGCFSGSGFCVTLSMLYMELRLINSEYTKNEITKVISNYSTVALRKYNTYMEIMSE